MTGFERFIKYCAMAFAIILTIGIIGGILQVAGLIDIADFHSSTVSVEDTKETYDYVKSLDIRMKTAALEIVEGDKCSVTTENMQEHADIHVNSSGMLIVKEKGKWSNFIHNMSSDAKIIIELPKDYEVEKAIIEMGTGKVTIKQLKAKKLDLQAGVGTLSGSNITANKANIEGGVGNLSFHNVNLNDLDLECGVGNVSMEGLLTGKCSIECDIGNVNLEVDNSKDDYEIDVDSGIGSTRVNGEKVDDYEWKGKNRKHKIDIDGDIGSMSLDFLK